MLTIVRASSESGLQRAEPPSVRTLTPTKKTAPPSEVSPVNGGDATVAEGAWDGAVAELGTDREAPLQVDVHASEDVIRRECVVDGFIVFGEFVDSRYSRTPAPPPT